MSLIGSSFCLVVSSEERLRENSCNHIVHTYRFANMYTYSGCNFMDELKECLQGKRMELFPTIVSVAKTMEVISPPTLSSQNASLLLVISYLFNSQLVHDLFFHYTQYVNYEFVPSLLQMYEELQVLSPLMPTREYFFLRYCQQIEQGLWAIADVSYDISQHTQFVVQSQSRRLPSGCLMQDLPDGYTKVVGWIRTMIYAWNQIRLYWRLSFFFMWFAFF